MSVAPIANPSLCPIPQRTKTSITPHLHHSRSLTNPFTFRDPSPHVSNATAALTRRCIVVARASPATESQPSKPEGGGGEGEVEIEEYEVELDKPYGLKFAKGRDGGTYIDAIAPGGAADKTGKFSVGDKVIATSAVFGTEIWPAAEYGRTMYTIRQRIGPLLMKMQKRYGKPIDAGELTDKEIIRAERNSGVVSSRVREIQMQNYMRKMEQKQQRESDLREGLKLYKVGKYEEALEKFESVLGSKPELNEVLSRVTM
ncbi:uncharacterized protein M6B38_326560 [Iris pallida]|uniref:PDZ domain-containing protein n=1 Tax=Iris pallida TaxID=29817 RepID=A0AAX6H733_IRIPA|nr:uncharacterized protein M6B38_326560 [Iris pallida]